MCAPRPKPQGYSDGTSLRWNFSHGSSLTFPSSRSLHRANLAIFSAKKVFQGVHFQSMERRLETESPRDSPSFRRVYEWFRAWHRFSLFSGIRKVIFVYSVWNTARHYEKVLWILISRSIRNSTLKIRYGEVPWKSTMLWGNTMKYFW